MATVSRESIAPLHDKITVKLAKEDYLPSFEKSLKQYAKQANVPGFRKGMVPAGMVKKMYGQSLFTDEVLRQASRELETYLNNEKVAIFAQPMAIPTEEPLRLDMNAPADVDLQFEIGLKPELEIPAFSNGTTLTKYKIAASDKMLDDEIDRIQRRFGKEENPETITSKENILYATIEATGSTPIEAVRLIENLPAKLQEQLIDKKVGDVITLTPAEIAEGNELATFLKDVLKAGEEAAQTTYTLTITKVGQVIPAELNTELFLQVFPNEMIADEGTFREKIRQELSKEFDRISNDRLNNEIFELLVHNTPIQLPVDFLKRWMKEGQESGKPKTDREVEQEFPGFEHQLRWTLISDKVILENGIQVTEKEVMDDIKGRVLAYFGMEAGEEAPWMEGYMQKVAKDEKTLNETYRQMLFNRLFEFLHTKFGVAEQEIGEEEFFKLPDAHTAHHHHH